MEVINNLKVLIPGPCHMPNSQGPWFVNIQVDYTAFDEYGPHGCTQFGSVCAVHTLWYNR